MKSLSLGARPAAKYNDLIIHTKDKGNLGWVEYGYTSMVAQMRDHGPHRSHHHQFHTSKLQGLGRLPSEASPNIQTRSQTQPILPATILALAFVIPQTLLQNIVPDATIVRASRILQSQKSRIRPIDA